MKKARAPVMAIANDIRSLLESNKIETDSFYTSLIFPFRGTAVGGKSITKLRITISIIGIATNMTI